MDLRDMQRGWLDIPPAHEHHDKTAMQTVWRARVSVHMTPNDRVEGRAACGEGSLWNAGLAGREDREDVRLPRL